MKRPRVRREHLVIVAGLAALLALCFRTAVRGDGISYYSYLPSVVVEHSLELQPSFDRFLTAHVPSFTPWLQTTSPTGLRANFSPVGPAVIAVPFYVAAHLLVGTAGGPSDPVLGAPYQLAFTGASLFATVLGLGLIFFFVQRRWGRDAAIPAIIAVIFATPLTAYIFFESSYSHGFTVFITTVFALYLYGTSPRRGVAQWFLVGLLGGLMTITRFQEFLFLALVPAEALWLVSKRAWSVRQLAPGYGAFAAGLLAGVLPQLVVDRVLYNSSLPVAAPNIYFDVAHLHLADLLFSTHHGWLSWSPLVLVALIGLPLGARRLGWFGWTLVGIGLAELVLNAALSDWWGGLAFGSRRMTDQTLLLAIGFAGAFSWLRVHLPPPGEGAGWGLHHVVARQRGCALECRPSGPVLLRNSSRCRTAVARLSDRPGAGAPLRSAPLHPGNRDPGPLRRPVAAGGRHLVGPGGWHPWGCLDLPPRSLS